ncbi:MAG: nucleoside recognition domain-containing protein [Bacteroidota bacterium]
MILNYIWIAFFLISFVFACVKLVVFNDQEIFQRIVTSTFENAENGFRFSLGLTGVMTLWLGIMRVGEKGGMINIFARLVGPFFARLFPEIPRNHPAIGAILMNFSANMLGLDNAATPLGLKAMEAMQELNPKKDTASNAQIMFLVLNTAGMTIIPISIMTYRAQAGAANPADIFIPALISTTCTALTGLIIVALFQRINLFNKVVLAYLGTIILLVGSIVYYFTTIPQDQIASISSTVSAMILFGVIVSFISLAVYKKINVYDSFIEGAKEGFGVAIRIIPYLVAMLVAIGVFRASGALDMIVTSLGYGFALLGMNTDFVPALPVAFMKPLSGGGARGLMLDAMKTSGVDSFVGRTACVLNGASETTFYVLAVYFGSVNIRNTRYAAAAGLLADLGGVIAAISLSYLFFH